MPSEVRVNIILLTSLLVSNTKMKVCIIAILLSIVLVCCKSRNGGSKVSTFIMAKHLAILTKYHIDSVKYIREEIYQNQARYVNKL